MRWSEILFLHWDVAPSMIARWVPDWLTLDKRRGRAFVGVVSLCARGPVPPLFWGLVHRLPAYAQVNVRTYVTGPQGPGIYLHKTSVGSVLAAAGARMLGQPYVPERAHIERSGDALEVESAPLSFEGVDGGGRASTPRGIEGWLLERYVLYGELPGRVQYHVRIRHAPWRVRRILPSLCETRVPEIEHAQPGAVLCAEPMDVDFLSLSPDWSTAHPLEAAPA